MLRHVAQLGKTLQPLKYQLDLPTHTVGLENRRRRIAGARREHENVLSEFECSRPGGHLLPTRLAVQASMSLFDRVVALFYCTQPPPKRGILTMQDDSPFAVLPHFGQSSQSAKERDTSSILVSMQRSSED